MWWYAVSWFLDPPDHTHAVCNVNHPVELLRQGEIRWQPIQAIRISLHLDFVTKTSPVIRKGSFCKQKVRRGNEVERDCKAHSVCHREWVGNLWRSVDLGCDVDHGGKRGHPIGVLRGWIENGDVKSLKEKDLCPRISSHRRRVGWVR